MYPLHDARVVSALALAFTSVVSGEVYVFGVWISSRRVLGDGGRWNVG